MPQQVESSAESLELARGIEPSNRRRVGPEACLPAPAEGASPLAPIRIRNGCEPRPAHHLAGAHKLGAPYSFVAPCAPTTGAHPLRTPRLGIQIIVVFHRRKRWSGKGDLNPRPSPWQGDALPLSYSRSLKRLEGCDSTELRTRCQERYPSPQSPGVAHHPNQIPRQHRASRLKKTVPRSLRSRYKPTTMLPIGNVPNNYSTS